AGKPARPAPKRRRAEKEKKASGPRPQAAKAKKCAKAAPKRRPKPGPEPRRKAEPRCEARPGKALVAVALPPASTSASRRKHLLERAHRLLGLLSREQRQRVIREELSQKQRLLLEEWIVQQPRSELPHPLPPKRRRRPARRRRSPPKPVVPVEIEACSSSSSASCESCSDEDGPCLAIED
ncbi:unnamed protein product, partial [Symbiodinium natans]